MHTPDAKDLIPLPELETLSEIAERFEMAHSEDTLFATADPDEIIRHVPGKRAILRGHLGIRPVAYKVHLADPAAAKRDWTELNRVWAYMKEGQAQVCAPLLHAPKAGIIAMSLAPGTPLLQLMYDSKPATRSKWLVPAAQWLRKYTIPTEATDPVDTDPWVKRAEEGFDNQSFHRLRRVEKPILREVHRLAESIRGQTWRTAISHGDFHPNNLMADGDTLTGIDCGGSRSAPIYKDIARFLMHMGRRGMIPSGEMQFGVDAMGLRAFCEAFALNEFERDLVLPFFLGVEALMRAETRDLPSSRIRRAKEMSDALLEDLKQVQLPSG